MGFKFHRVSSEMQMALRFLLLIAAVSGLSSEAKTVPADPPAFPNSPAGRALTSLTKAVNAGSEAALKTYVERQFSAAAKREQSVEQIVRCLKNVHRRAGTLTWDAIYPQTSTYIGAFAWGENAPYRRQDGTRIFVRLETGTDTPDAIDRFEFQAAEAPIEPLLPYPPAGASEAIRIRAIRQGAALAAKAGRLSGVVLIQRNGRTLFSVAYGQASREFNVPNRLTTRFNLASVGKVFTTVAAMQLVAAGKLRYAVPIRTYLPDYPQPAIADKITLRHLLTHTSGLGDIFGPGKDDPNHHFQTLTDYLPLFASEPLLFEPGHGNAYSNAGLLLVSLIVERVSGMPFETYLRQHIFAPAGMTGVDYAPLDAVCPERAIGYTADRSEDPLSPTPLWKNNLRYLVSLGTGPATGAGGGYATADDLARFANALLENRLLPRHFLDEAVAAGLGFEVGEVSGHKRFGHAGAGPGMNTSLFVYPDSGYTVVVLSNLDPAFAQVFAERIGEVLMRP